MNRFPWMASLVAVALAARPANAQRPELEQISLSGPRLGVTYVTGPVGRAKLAEHDLDPLISQFGWHFEQVVRPRSGGPLFVIEEVLLIGAVDQGTAIPSATVLLGIRMPSGFEFGMGPNATPVGTGLAIGIGKSLQYGGVSLPLNLAVVRSPGALRISFIFGYALQSARRTRE